ncbi:YraN family protein [Zhongshania sp. BJYM1]|uniref:YraN family protein n=1 Tax=Zhongshania aquatica TaxID=2965069 RepID=UPI0022B35D25|nr:YraN family protein [Marortus sp. BJYM1]
MIFKRTKGIDAGILAEQGACRFLQKHNLKILKQNYRSRFGEIDIIALSDQYLIFVEVRYRQNTSYGSAAESVTRAKQQRIINTARHFLSRGLYNELPCRFDVIEASSDKSGNLHFNWLSNAFQE